MNLDKNKFFERCEYVPHSEGQHSFHQSTAKHRIACCGRRWGKSKSAGMEMAFHCLKPDAYYWIVGPTYRLGEKEFRVVHDAFINRLKIQHKSFRVSYDVKQGNMKMKFPWNTVIEVVSATNSDSLLGEGLDGVIMSEAARHSLETWEMYVEPALSDKDGFAIFPSTPKGFNWFQGMWQLGQQPDMRDQYESWHFPTWTNTVSFPGGLENEKLQRIKNKVSPQYWKQEYGAEFTTFQGQIYDEFDPRIHVTDVDYNPAWRNYWVFDYGFNDPFVCLDIMVDPSDNVYVWREYMERHLATWDHATRLQNRQNPTGFHLDGMFGDPRGADEAATIALKLGQVFSADVPWITGIEAVKQKLKLQPDGRPQLYIDRSCSTLIRQMQALRHKEAKAEKNPAEGQVDYDDHGPDALRYFIGQYFVLGGGGRLADAYDGAYLGSEAETFFSLRRGITLDTEVGFGVT